jgi:class 3 adenylate cyclase
VRDAATSEHVRSHRGRLRTRTADSILATFDAPGQAIRCAAAIRAGAAAHGIQSRIGIHTGEVGLEGDDINGIAVEIAKRIAARASAGEILVSRTVKDLLVGSRISFAHHASYPLAAPDDRWPLFAVTAT